MRTASNSKTGQAGFCRGIACGVGMGHWVLWLWLLLGAVPAKAQDTFEAHSLVASYVFPESVEEVPGEAFSRIASYVFAEPADAVEESFGPVVSFVFAEALPDDLTREWTSLPVSYYRNGGVDSSPVVLSGRVLTVEGVPVGGASVRATVFGQAASGAVTDGFGRYELPALLPGLYELTASAPGWGRDRRIVRLGSIATRQDFALAALPPGPTLTDSIRQPRPTEIPSPVTVGGSRLKVFDGERFVPNLALLDRDLPTVVMTHGWTASFTCKSGGGIEGWPTDMANAMRSHGISAAVANIVGWDWYLAANNCPLPPDDVTPFEGMELALALQSADALGVGYAHPVHFMGHSLGTLVNGAAATFLQGKPVFDQPGSLTPWRSDRMHMTLFDEAEIAAYSGVLKLPVNGLARTIRRQRGLTCIDGQWVLPAGAGPGSYSVLKDPLPPTFAWADNYQSSIVSRFFWDMRAVNIDLHQWNDLLSPIEAHGEAYEWYMGTVTNRSVSVLGFIRSHEAAVIDPIARPFPPTDSVFGPGRVWRQRSETVNAWSLELAPTEGEVAEAFADNTEAILARGVAVAEKMVATTAGAIEKFGNVVVERVENAAIQSFLGFRHLAGKAAEAASSIVDLMERPSFRLLLTTGQPPLINPGQNRSGAPAADSNLPAYAWFPVQIPADALVMVFDYRMDGDPAGDNLAVGLNGTNVLRVVGRHTLQGVPQASGLIDVSHLAGTTAEVFVGITGGTSTNCAVTVENLRFHTLQAPQLAVEATEAGVRLSWPSSAMGYRLEAADALEPASWQAVSNAPALFQGRVSVTHAATGHVRFFRLRRE